MKRNRWLAATLALVFALGLFALPALADDDAPPAQRFADMDDAPWALSAVATMNVEGIIKGDGAGHFRPADAVSHQEAIALAIRVMGLESQAKALDLTSLNLGIADFASVSAWAQADVALAAQKGFLPPLDGGNFEPTAPATRLWAAIMLDKALGYDAEAQANMNATLSFADAASIPASAVGYVYVAASHNLFKGIAGADGKIYFQPNGPVTRAQIAVLLARSDEQLAFTPERAEQQMAVIHGRVTATDGSKATITIDHHGISTTYTLAANASVFVDEKTGTLAQVQSGMRVKLILNAQGQAILVSARAAQAEDDDRTAVDGFFVSSASGQITLLVRQQPRSISLAATYVVMVRGQVATLADIASGANVNVRLDANGKAVFLDANNPNREDDRDRGDQRHEHGTGTISAIVAGQGAGGPVSLEITGAAGAKVTYSLAPNVKIEAGDKTLTVADLKAGDLVEYKLQGNSIVELRVLMESK